ncbi:hypothetical protein K2X30_02070 [bacterium]|jgi:hypothetical protein|nr:hypothetical protein [bacterium]
MGVWVPIIKLAVSAVMITLASWVAGKKPSLAGFIISLPISTMLVLAMTQVEFKDTEKTVQFAKSIFIGIPLSLTFFIPFLLADRLKIGFWGLYLCGVSLLSVSYFVHKALTTP